MENIRYAWSTQAVKNLLSAPLVVYEPDIPQNRKVI